MKLIGLALAALLCAAPAEACSVIDSYRVPTNLELADQSEIVMLARVVSGPTSPGRDQLLTVVPLEVLKGHATLGQPMQVPGSIAEPRFAVLSFPLNLEDAHPLAYIGSCYRTMFVKDATVLFFLRHYDANGEPAPTGRLAPAGGAFSRWAEDVVTPNAPWVRATKIYLEASGKPKDRQAAFLTAERDALVKAGDQDSKVIAADIDRQLKGPNKPWNERMADEIRADEERRKAGAK